MTLSRFFAKNKKQLANYAMTVYFLVSCPRICYYKTVEIKKTLLG